MLAEIIGLLGVMAVVPAQADTLDAVREMRAELGAYYYDNVGRYSQYAGDHQAVSEILGWECDADEGYECFDSDPNWSWCRADSACDGRRPRGPLLAEFMAKSSEHPASGFLVGHAVYLAQKSNNHLGALQLLEECGAALWWCSALRGMVLQDAGRPTQAQIHFDSFAASAPDSIVCDVVDATWLLGEFELSQSGLNPIALEARRPWADRSCGERAEASRTLFWLADPLFIVDGNDRWTEYLSKVLVFRLSQEISDARPSARARQAGRDLSRSMIARRGPRDSWARSRNPEGAGRVWTSHSAARYHFLPDFEGGDFSRPTWSLQSDFDLEGYTPAYAPFFPAAVQIARFRSEAAGLQRIAAATSVAGTPIESAVESGYLVFTDAPESFPLQLEAQFQDARAVYLPDAEPKPYVASFEILTAEGIGWHREQLQPLALEGDGVSDLLLYRPVGMEEPISLLAAAALMHGSTEVEAAEQGLFWEVYGAPEGTPIEFSLEIRSEETGGLMNQVRRLFGGAEERDATLSWSEPSQGERHARAIILDLRDLEPGEYTVALRATWSENDAIVTADRSVSVR